MHNIIFFFKELSLNSGAIWLENETVKLSTPKALQNDDTRNFVVSNKARIMEVLRENHIFSKEQFLNVLIFKSGTAGACPLSPAQERLWFIEQYEEGSNAYHLPAIFELAAGTQADGIKYALRQIVARHEVLRSTITANGPEGHAVQQVHDEALRFDDVTAAGEADLEILLEAEINKPFDLSTSYPIRVTFYQVQPGTQDTGKIVVLINIHHIATDAWSSDIFQRELQAYYEAYLRQDTGFSLPPLDIQYKDYALWQRSYLSGEVLDRQLSYWKNKLAGFQTLELPTDYPRPAEIDYSGASQAFEIDEETAGQLRALAQRCGVTLYSVMLSSLHILLSKYSGQEDIVTGSAIANRHHRQTEGLIGFFVNTQVNRTVLNPEQPFAALVQEVHQQQVQAQLYQELPFEKLVEELGVERDASRHPVFQVMFGIQDIGGAEQQGGEQKNYLLPYQAGEVYQVEKFDLSFFIYHGPDSLMGEVSYATALFNSDTITRFTEHYTHLLRQLATAPEQPYSQHSLLGPEEYAQVVEGWNATLANYPENITIHALFEQQAERLPNHTAVFFEGQHLTYGQLDARSNQLARHITTQYHQRTGQHFAPDTLVALYMDKSLEMIVGILAVLKAGGAYVPLDINYPQERIDYLLEDTAAPLILTRRHLVAEGSQRLPGDRLMFTGFEEACYEIEDSARLPQQSGPGDLAYVIYTSGTTGKPKGVKITHKSLVNLVCVQEHALPIDAQSNMLQYASLIFDAAVWEIFSALSFGARLSIVPETLRQDAQLLVDYMRDQEISITLLPPVLLEMMPYIHLPQLKTLLVGGDVTTAATMDKWSRGRRLINAYGPTENTVIATLHTYTAGDKHNRIGRPIDNCTVYVLDRDLLPVPIGVTGELYIGGGGLARGYLNNDGLTHERFIPNPFTTEARRAKGYTRLYKTGDLVRWLPDGGLEYMGRNDNQVKIRGFRIELGEIEHTLSQLPGIRQCCVVAKDRITEGGPAGKYLVAYYVLEHAGDGPSSAAITSQLLQVLPEYMVPGILVALDAFPLTISGKLDKQALPDPDFSEGEDYVKPGTGLEIKLCQIYAEVLGLASDQVSTHQNFFKMGGNSILSIQLKTRLNRLEQFRHISVADVFKYNSVNKLIQSIGEDEKTEYTHNTDLTPDNQHEIAIIGVSGAFSGAANLAEFWELIAGQLEGVKFYTREEFVEMGIDDAVFDDPAYVPVEGKVEGMELFDPAFWDMSPNEAKLLDPQIRKFVEQCWFALESSGYAPLRKSRHIGVFAGSGYSNYFYDHILHGEMAGQINIWEAATANSKDALATKTAFLLGLSGPANSINTACSTGLVAVVEACKNLRLGTCNMALAGGVSLAMPYQIGYVYEEGMISSKDGHCRTFDQESSGTTGGSGAAVVLLKRLSDAVADNDHILGVIKGYATNNDGDRKTGFTAPSLTGQTECIINAQAMAGVGAAQIDYVECHGTATHLGDPIEVQALQEAFRYNAAGTITDGHTIVLGAVKANIGHTDSAAGTAGLIKVLAMLQHQTLPGQVNFSTPNPELRLEQTNFEIITENREWAARPGTPRMAGVSSFGVGGTNAHVIISEYIHNPAGNSAGEKSPPATARGHGKPQYIIPLSAKSRQSLEGYKQALAEYLVYAQENELTVPLAALAYTLEECRVHFNYRAAYVVSGIEELTAQLTGGTAYAECNTETRNKLVFMFPGQGAQYTQMAKALYQNEPHFKNTVHQCISLANQHLDTDLFDVLYPEGNDAAHNINDIRWSPVCLFTIEYALARYLEHLGVQADACIGHSFGEYVAATLSGVFSLEDAIKVLIARGRFMQAMPAGSMLSVNAKEAAVKPLAAAHHCEISLINSADDVVVSGLDHDIQAMQRQLEQLNIPVVKLVATVAAHSKLMDAAAAEFEKFVAGITLNKPEKDFVSNVTGEIAGDEVTTAAYWASQLRNTVQFAKGISSLCRRFNYQVSFIEVGAGKGLSYFVNKYKMAHGYRSVHTVQLLPTAKEANSTGQPTFQAVNRQADMKARLWMHGILDRANESGMLQPGSLITDLPGYQFDQQECWLERSAPRDTKQFNALDEMFYERSWERTNLQAVPAEMEDFKHRHVLVLVNDCGGQRAAVNTILGKLNDHCDHLHYAIHGQDNDLEPGSSFHFDNAAHMETLLHTKTAQHGIDLVIYISPSIDMANTGLDVFAVRHLFSWLKESGNTLPQFISISLNNYEVTGNETLQEHPSVIYGAAKSIPFEYFTSGTKALHIDYSLQDDGYINTLLPALLQPAGRDFYVVRGRYRWFPTYRQQLQQAGHQLKATNGFHAAPAVYLITGGLGGVGYAYAAHLAEAASPCTLIIIGRSREDQLRSDYKERLAQLRATHHRIIYAALDIGGSNTGAQLQQLLAQHQINAIEVILHSAGVAAKSAMVEKTRADMEQVINPKITGVEHLIQLGRTVKINNLVSCSSLTSIMPAIGNMEYTAANLYLDEISNRSHPGIKHMLTINLNQVTDTGMAVDFIKSTTSNEGMSQNAIMSYEFPVILEQLLTSKNGNNIALSRFDVNQDYLENTRLFDHLNDPVTAANIPTVKIIEPSYTEAEYKMAQIFGDALGVEQVSVHDDFFRLGGNSIHAIHVSHRMSKALNCDIFVADLFKYKTISKIKEFVLMKTGNDTVVGQEIEI